MEAVMMPYSRNQNQKWINNNVNRGSVSGFTENFVPASYIYGGQFLNHLHDPIFDHRLHQIQIQMNPRQPPLLPLPISRSRSSVPSRSRASKSGKPTRDHSLTPKKQNQAMTRPDPKVAPRVLSPSDLEKWSDSVFTLSPPPSSLPLPRFQLRPKRVDAGETDNLRQILRLR